MMTPDEIIDLLSLAAVYDQRTGGKRDVQGWCLVAETERWTTASAQRVLIEHYSRGADRPRITPAAISDGIRAARHKAAASFIVPDIPEHITGRDYPTWYRTELHMHIDRRLDAWAAGEPIPESTEALSSQVRAALTMGPDMGTCPVELREQFVRDMNRAGRERVREVPQRLPRQPAGDPDRRSVAYAEIAALSAARPEADEQ